jgi:iron complex transport system permease protein
VNPLENYYKHLQLEYFRKNKYRVWIALAALTILMIATFFTSINLGRAYIGPRDIAYVILGRLFAREDILSLLDETTSAIIWDIRLPRILCAFFVGGGLAVSGTIFQSVLMNPMADSYTMGVSTGAAFGASIAIYLNIMAMGFAIPITAAAFLGAVLTLCIVMTLSKVRGYLSPVNLILSGIIVSSILSAGVTLIKNAAGENVGAIVGWMMGSLSSSSWSEVFLVLPVTALGTLIPTYFANSLNLLSLGDEEARFLGVDPEKSRRIFLTAASMITAACVSVSGIIGFVGLIVPHMLRLVLGADNRKLIPFSMLLGGELLLVADTVARVLLRMEIPVGVITTMLGGPFFLFIFIRKNRRRYV